ncbi:FG-GAP repeat domain-containing protein, partial [Pyxidicoccus sp. 3LG]
MFQWQQLASIQGLHVTLTDANKDGLADALLYSPGSGTSTLYANTGDGFVAQPVGAFASLGMGVSAPLAADVVGSGNAELYCLVAGLGVREGGPRGAGDSGAPG